MADAPLPLDDCGCCAGTDAETPVAIHNAPGLPAIVYRAGTYTRFKESIAARLSAAELPALAPLRARTDDDFTIALADAFAVMVDVLTFYQERAANEAFLRTATERRSVLELAQLLGYELSPGVAASTWLAFTLEESRGAPGLAPRPVTIETGTKVQSIPGRDEQPQTFETVAPIEARVERNAMRVQTRAPQAIEFGLQQLYLDGTGHQLAPGDAVLIVGAERENWPGSEQWDVRPLQTVEQDEDRKLTRITWLQGLGHEDPRIEPATDRVQVFVFRQRAALFGHNAPDPLLLSNLEGRLGTLANIPGGGWRYYHIQDDQIDLDQAYPKIVARGWVALASADIKHDKEKSPLGYVELYRAEQVSIRSRTDFGLSSRITRISPDTQEHLAWYELDGTLVFAQSEQLPLAEAPVRAPLYGDRVPLAGIVPDLAKGQALAVSGKRQHLRIAEGAKGLQTEVAGRKLTLKPGDRLALVAPPTRMVAGAPQQLEPEEMLEAIDKNDPAALTWTLADRDGNVITLNAGADKLELDSALKDDETFAEIAFAANAADGVTQDRDRTHLRLSAPLKRCYDRETVAINANVAPATHGETVTNEILGDGDAAARDQRFTLKQSPLTFVSAQTPSGRASTLEVRVDGTLWKNVASLYARGRREHVYTTRIEDDARATVAFGDGFEGARLPSGTQNVRARYRKGIGSGGNLRAGQLSTLLTRALGVMGASNPEPATGGDDPETLTGARRNAPLSVLTLDRAVSLRDYADFARSFAGVAKAHSAWIASGPARGVFVTVAGPAGGTIGENSKTYKNLSTALRSYGDPLVALAVRSYDTKSFKLRAKLKLDLDALADAVLDKVRAELRGTFAFEAREFEQPVTLDEVIAVIHGVNGVLAVDVDALYRPDEDALPGVRARLFAAAPLVTGAKVAPAELLTLDAASLDIVLMP